MLEIVKGFDKIDPKNVKMVKVIKEPIMRNIYDTQPPRWNLSRVLVKYPQRV